MATYFNIQYRLKNNDPLIPNPRGNHVNTLTRQTDVSQTFFDLLARSSVLLNLMVDQIDQLKIRLSIENTLKILEMGSAGGNARAAYLCGSIYGDLVGNRIAPNFISTTKSIFYLTRAVQLGAQYASVTLIKAITRLDNREHFRSNLPDLQSICDKLIAAKSMYAALVYGDLLCGISVGYPTHKVATNKELGMRYLEKAYALADVEEKQLVCESIAEGCSKGLLPTTFYLCFMPTLDQEKNTETPSPSLSC